MAVLARLTVFLILVGSVQNALCQEAYTHTRDIRLAPGEWLAVRYDSERCTFVETEPDRGLGCLTRRTLLQILRAPAWVREDLAQRLVDLAGEAISVVGDACPAFGDVNGDGISDLLVGTGEGRVRCFLGPYFREDPDRLSFAVVPGSADPCLYDLDRDGDPELVVGGNAGVIRAWSLGGQAVALPGRMPFVSAVHPALDDVLGLVVTEANGVFWYLLPDVGFDAFKGVNACAGRAVSNPIQAGGNLVRVYGGPEGGIEGRPIGAGDDGLIENLNRLEVAGRARPVFHDLNGDGAPELVVGAADGTLTVFENRGRPGHPWFAVYSEEIPRKFKGEVDYLSTPRIADMNGDGVADLISGCKEGSLYVFPGPGFEKRPFSPKLPRRGGSTTPAPADFDGDGAIDLAVGDETGAITVFLGPSFEPDRTWSNALKVDGFATPYSGDMNGDGKPDLIVGSGSGEILLFANTGAGFQKEAGYFKGLDAGAYPSPAAHDVDGDGKTDLVVGDQKGRFHVFLAPDWKPLPTGLGVSNTGPFAAAGFGDLDGDGRDEMVVGDLDGGFTGFVSDSGVWVEKDAWIFEPATGLETVADYFQRLHPDRLPLRGKNDMAAVEAFTALLEGAPDRFVDEIAFSIAHLPTEVLRAMARLDEQDVLLENAALIYQTAGKLAYVDIVEKESRTTLRYGSADGKSSVLPDDLYYWWVVHPRVYHEIPLRINAAYWSKDWTRQGITEEQWTRKRVQLEDMGKKGGGAFWRRHLAEDRKYGKNLVEVAGKATTLLEAVTLAADWASQSTPQSWFTYGLKSADLQPNVIYEKNYGSCGEASILGAAMGRTLLIPTACTGCGGEDHIWNEFWMDGQWHAWDLCASSARLRFPWACCEREEHRGTQVLTVTRKRGDGLVEDRTAAVAQPEGSGSTRTGKGYTDVGRVSVRVIDGEGEPVEGAAVIIRSNCRDYWRVSIWGFTDPEGVCRFDLGRPHKRCLIDVITQQGLTGTSHFPVEENRDYEITYQVSGRFKRPVVSDGRDGEQPRDPRGTDRLSVRIASQSEWQQPRNLQTAQRKPREETAFFKKTGYRGTRWTHHPMAVPRGVCAAVLSERAFERFRKDRDPSRLRRIVNGTVSDVARGKENHVVLFFNPNRFTHVRFRASVTITAKKAVPVIRLDGAPTELRTGETGVFTGVASDNLHLATLHVSFDDGQNWQDISHCLDRASGRFRYAWRTASGKVVPPGTYRVRFRTTDASGAEALSGTRTVQLDGARDFLAQRIFQDDPESPLPKSSWMLGPFRVTGKERFLGIHSATQEEGFDMDLFLFHDRNGNRRLDGMDEVAAKSTTPTALEKIVLNNPRKGVFWIYCQGWQVPEKKVAADDGDDLVATATAAPSRFLAGHGKRAAERGRFALLDLYLSFGWAPAFIVDVGPVGPVERRQAEIAGRFEPPLTAPLSSFSVLVNGEDMTARARVGLKGFALPLSDLKTDEKHDVRVVAVRADGGRDEATWAFRPVHRPLVVEAAVDESAETVTVSVRDKAGRPVSSARVRWRPARQGDFGDWRDLSPAEGNGPAEATFPLMGLRRGRHVLEVEARFDSGEAETQASGFLLSKNHLPKKAVWVYPSHGKKVYDFRPVLSAIVSSEYRGRVVSVRMVLDGTDITGRFKTYADGAKFFPREKMKAGPHVFECVITLKSGRKLEARSEFTVAVMGEDDY